MSTSHQMCAIEPAVSPSQGAHQKHWYALRTRSRHEKVVAQRLCEDGLETYLPIVHEVHRWSDRKKKVEVPLFSCYLFVRCAWSSEDRTRVYRVESALGFVGVRGAGLPIPDEQIESVRTALAQPKPCRSLPFLKVGQRVRVCGGAMDGVEGVFLSENGDQSLVISIDAIQRSLAVRIDGYQVKPI